LPHNAFQLQAWFGCFQQVFAGAYCLHQSCIANAVARLYSD
jgi:hypothetical protein